MSLATTGVFRYKNSSTEDEPMDVLVRSGFDLNKFAEEVQRRKTELETSSTSNVDLLRAVIKLSNNTTLFRIQRIDEAHVSELLFFRGTSAITARLYSFGKTYLTAEKVLLRFADGVRAVIDLNFNNKRNEFCLGSIKIGGEFETEKANFLF